MTRVSDAFNPLFRAEHPQYHMMDLVHRWTKTATQTSGTANHVRKAIENTLDGLGQSAESLHLLDLSGCGLGSLPAFSILQHLEGITILDLRDNRLEGRELGKLSALTSLKQLYLSDNPLIEIPEGAIQGQSQLSILELENCQLQVFPADILMLSRLDSLILSGNVFEKLPNNLGFCLPDLANLDLRHTGVKTLPDSLKYLHELTVLKNDIPVE
jgi:Leucine-rich repeat (LRR) protein